MKKIILDTNFLVDCLMWKVDFFRELDRIIPCAYKLFAVDKTLDELDTIITEGKQDVKIGARLAKQVILKNRISLITTDKKGYTDMLILKNAGREDIVATQDQELKRKLKAKGIHVVIIRQKKYLELIER